MGLGGARGGAYQQQVPDLVLGLVAAGPHVLHGLGKGSRGGVSTRGRRAPHSGGHVAVLWLTMLSTEGARGRTLMARGVFTMDIFMLLAGLLPAKGGAA